VQQHENLQLIVASQVDQLWQLSSILTLFASISKPLWPSVPQEQRWQADNFTLHEWRKPSLYGRKSQDQDRDQDL